MAIDHLGIPVKPSEFKAVVAFYLAVLKPLGYTHKATSGPNGEFVGIGAERIDYWIHSTSEAPSKLDLHLAFTTTDCKVVDAFYAAAIESGAKDNGPPGLRTRYHANYYGAFVTDPVGINLEVVCHSPLSA